MRWAALSAWCCIHCQRYVRHCRSDVMMMTAWSEFRGKEFAYVMAFIFLIAMVIVLANIFTGGKVLAAAGKVFCGLTTLIGLGPIALGLLGGCI